MSSAVGIPEAASSIILDSFLMVCRALCHPDLAGGDGPAAGDGAETDDLSKYCPDGGDTFISSMPIASPLAPSAGGLPGFLAVGGEGHGVVYPEDAGDGDDDSDSDGSAPLRR